MVPGHGAPVAFQDSTAGALCVMLARTAPAGGCGVWVSPPWVCRSAGVPLYEGSGRYTDATQQESIAGSGDPHIGPFFSKHSDDGTSWRGRRGWGPKWGTPAPSLPLPVTRPRRVPSKGRPPSPQTRNTDPNGRHRASPIRKQRRLAGRTDRDLRRQSAAPRHAFAVCGGSTETPRQMA